MLRLHRGVAIVFACLVFLSTGERGAQASLSFVTVPGNTILLEGGVVVAQGAAGDEAAFDLQPSLGAHTFVVRRPHFDDATLDVKWTGRGWIRAGRPFPGGTRVRLAKSVQLAGVMPGEQVYIEKSADRAADGPWLTVAGMKHSVDPLLVQDGHVTIPDAWFPRPLFVVRTGYEPGILLLPARSLDTDTDVVAAQLTMVPHWFLRWPALLLWCGLGGLGLWGARGRRSPPPALEGVSPFLEGGYLVGQDGTRYRVLERIGTGSTGEVYQVLDEGTGALRAAKVWFSAPSSYRQARYEREVTICARLSHPGLVRVHGFGVLDWLGSPRPFMIEDLVSGQTLAELLKGTPPMPWPLAVERTRELLQALGAAHAEGIVHRDVSPSNIMVESNGAVRLMDFGLAWSRDEASLTASGAALGTPYYMSPEQFDNSHEATAGADIYAAGVIFYQMLTGRLPFRQTEIWSLLHEKIVCLAPSVLDVDASIPEAVGRAVAGMLHADRKVRFSRVEDVLALLELPRPGRDAASLGATMAGLDCTGRDSTLRPEGLADDSSGTDQLAPVGTGGFRR